MRITTQHGGAEMHIVTQVDYNRTREYGAVLYSSVGLRSVQIHYRKRDGHYTVELYDHAGTLQEVTRGGWRTALQAHFKLVKEEVEDIECAYPRT